MTLFTVDESKCCKDGLCARDCPMGIIAAPSALTPPRPHDNAESKCMQCGHCAAICPNGALSLTAMPLASMLLVRPELRVSPEQADQFLRARRSIRKYKPDLVPQTELARLVELGRFAPSGHNRQPVCWSVFSGRDSVRAVAEQVVGWMRWLSEEQPERAAAAHVAGMIRAWDKGHDVIFRNAPHLIVAHAPRDERTAPPACVLALCYLELAASARDLGTCWAGFFQTAAASGFEPLQKVLALPPGHQSMGALMLGYPVFKYHRLPDRRPARIDWR